MKPNMSANTLNSQEKGIYYRNGNVLRTVRPIFRSQRSLDQHLEDSTAHAPVYECEQCGQSFGSQQSVNQHMTSLMHAPLYKCDDCDRWFGSPDTFF